MSISFSLLLAPTSNTCSQICGLHFSCLVSPAVCLSVRIELVGWASSCEVWWSVSSVDVDGPWSEARAWLLKRSLFCASEPALPVLFHPCR